jgi:hypothetical protein
MYIDDARSWIRDDLRWSEDVVRVTQAGDEMVIHLPVDDMIIAKANLPCGSEAWQEKEAREVGLRTSLASFENS